MIHCEEWGETGVSKKTVGEIFKHLRQAFGA